ncbi:Zinc transporter ZIP4 [Dissostichus eleginoides]|uniref:Zinc transporter ZIP4 n=1 Tax=Dissostichus eleginoides TaxID=100907 RepID=A0AAD9EXW1_DISEL|nr:Zinc transporter ZIP4 [Dissostichus eleginoides]
MKQENTPYPQTGKAIASRKCLDMNFQDVKVYSNHNKDTCQVKSLTTAKKDVMVRQRDSEQRGKPLHNYPILALALVVQILVLPSAQRVAIAVV